MSIKRESYNFWLDQKNCQILCVLATVINTEGSTYSKKSSQMIISNDSFFGFLSIGCLEKEIIDTARSMLRNSKKYDWISPKGWKKGIIQRIDMSDESDIFFGSGAGCGGITEVLLEILPLNLNSIEEEEIFLFQPKDFESENLFINLEKKVEIFPEIYESLFYRSNKPISEKYIPIKFTPIPLVSIFGAGDDVIPIALFGQELGWHLTIFDYRSHLLTSERFPKANLKLCRYEKIEENLLTSPINLLITHNLLHDLEILNRFIPLEKSLPYIGLLGSKIRIQKLKKIGKSNSLNQLLQKIDCPVGLPNWKTNTPESIALSIVSNIQQKIDSKKILLPPKQKKQPNIACVILAAGGSTRLGKPKQNIFFRGKTLLEDITSKARLLQPSTLKIVLNESILIPKSIPQSDVIINREWQQGIGGSIKLALKTILLEKNIDGVFLFLCDQPFIRISHFKELLDTFKLNKEIVATSYQGTIGIPAIFPNKYFQQLLQIDSSLGAKKIIFNNLGKVIQVPCEEAKIDIDTQKDLELLMDPKNKKEPQESGFHSKSDYLVKY